MSEIIEFPNKRKRPPGNKKSNARLLVLCFIFVLMLGGVGARLVQIQAVQADQLDGMAREQRSRSLKIAPDRGKIIDRNGEILAISIEMDTIYATPYLVENRASAAKRIARILKEEPGAVYAKLTRKTGFEYLRRKAERQTADKIRELDIDGIGFLPESKRFYPGRTLASHTIGFVGLDNVGLAGLELSFDEQLRGEPGSLDMEQDISGRPIPGTELISNPPTHGLDLKLTIDKEIQHRAQVELEKAVNEWDAAGGWVVVMNSKTGEVYALACEPTFDLNKFATSDSSVLRNGLVADVYEPGSTMKIVTVAAALEEKLYSPDFVFSLPGTLAVGGYTIGEAHPRGEELFTFSEVLEKSSNIGAVTIGRALGADRVYEYATRFGMNTQTGIELPVEGQGYIPTTDQWSASTLATVSFGQGISATAFEIIRAVNVVASGGTLVSPRLVEGTTGSNPDSREINSETGSDKRVLSTGTANTMASILQRAVEDGTGKGARIDGYSVGGKTGTAQKPKKDAPGYESGKYISSFVGFTPVEDPAVTILVAIDEPQGMYYGGVVAAPVFAAVGEYSLQRLKITP